MVHIAGYILSLSILLLINFDYSFGRNVKLPTDELENFINPEDLDAILKDYEEHGSTEIIHNALIKQRTETLTTTVRPQIDVGCHGTWNNSVVQVLNRIFKFNLNPMSADKINTHFYFMSRKMSSRVQVFPGKKIDTKLVDFDPKRKTVLIIHGFMSHSGSNWVTEMAKAYLEREDVNVIAVDWSGGSKTFKYWRAVANTRSVGKDITSFMRQLKNEVGLDIKTCHFIGHSLGAQIASFASSKLGKVGRITGLDPALPCYNTTDDEERLDPTDANFVDVIHTNAKLLIIGFGFPYPTGHVDFYPNGGIRQPGCLGRYIAKIPIIGVLLEAICSHGRSYLLFTESLTNKKCSFKASPWNMTVSGLEESVSFNCDGNSALCPEMGINAARKANGSFLTFTKDKEPYCETEFERHHPARDLLQDITDYLHSFSKQEAKASKKQSTVTRWIAGIYKFIQSFSYL